MDEYEHYEKLLLERDQLDKAAGIALTEYLCAFGEPLRSLHEIRFEIIRLKKSVAFCQRARNRGLPIDLNAMEDFLARQLAPYRDRLNTILTGIRAAENADSVGEHTALRVKKLYRKLAKQLHPDLHPAFEENEEILDLWLRIMRAYQGNDLTALQELEVLAAGLLTSLGEETERPDIPDLEERSSALEQEIEHIRTTDPYLYRELLCDPDAVEEKLRTMEESLEQLCKQRDRLAARLQDLTLKGDTIWKVTLN